MSGRWFRWSVASCLAAVPTFLLLVSARVAVGTADAPKPQVIGTRPAAVEVPSERPFVGAEGEDAFGYPLRTADRIVLGEMLRLKMFDQLDRYLSAYQADFEADPKKEYWPLDAFDSFAAEDPAMGAALDEWVEARPQAWTARMARGAYRAGLAWFQRGAATAAKTSAARFSAMEKTLAGARADLLKALAEKPTLVAAQRQLVIMGNLGGEHGAHQQKALAAALKTCPACFQVRVSYIFSLRPRWGGSYTEMRAFAKEAELQARNNPRLRVLAGYVDQDRCNRAIAAKKWDEAAERCEPLRAYGHWELDLELANSLWRRKRLKEAIDLLDGAVRQRPQDEKLLRYRLYVLDDLERWEDVGKTALTLRRLNVTDPHIADLAETAVKRLVHQAYDLGRAKDFARARDFLDLALAIDPEHANAKGLYASLPAFQAAMTPKAALGMDAGESAEIAALKKAVADDPDDLQARLDLDAGLFRFNRFDEIVESWDDYLRRHPDDGRALLERAGTHSHRRDADKALADLDAACDLGISEGCRAAAMLRQRLGR